MTFPHKSDKTKENKTNSTPNSFVSEPNANQSYVPSAPKKKVGILGMFNGKADAAAARTNHGK